MFWGNQRVVCSVERRQEGTGFIFHHEIEQRLISDGVRVVVLHEFSMGDLVSPGTWVASTEDLKVHFNLLVYMFCFTVRLGMVGS